MNSTEPFRNWRAAKALREKFELQGFCVLRAHAEAASQIARGAFTTAEFLEDVDRRGDDYVASHFDIFVTQPASQNYPVIAEFWRHFHRLSDSEVGEQFTAPLTAAKERDLALLSETSAKVIRRRTDIRAYAAEVARLHGYAKERNFSSPYPPSFIKHFPSTGLTGGFWIDVGGLKVGPPLNIAMNPFLHRAENEWYGLEPSALCLGVDVYETVSQAASPRQHRRYEDETYLSNMLKIGVVALTSYFDLFLRSFEEID